MAAGDFVLASFTPTGDFVLTPMDGEEPGPGGGAEMDGDFTLQPFTPDGNFVLYPVGTGEEPGGPGVPSAVAFVEDEAVTDGDVTVYAWDSEVDYLENEVLSVGNPIVLDPDGPAPDPSGAYLTLNGVHYRVLMGEGRGAYVQIETRRRAIDGTLLIDPRATKMEAHVKVTGVAGSDRYFTIPEADAFARQLAGSGALYVSGQTGTFRASARDITYEDGQDFGPSGPVIYRWITATLDEI